MSINKEQNMEDAILSAATQLVLEKGFKATSTTEIAKKVGCNQALVHYYYRTKDRLFDAIFEKKVKSFISTLIKVDNEDIPFKVKLTRMIESHFEAIMEDPKLPLFIFNEINSNPIRLKQLRDKLDELPDSLFIQMKTDLDAEIEVGNIRRITIYDLLLSIVSLNIMVFILEPMFKTITRISDEDFIKLRERRKKENVHVILNSLKP